MMLNLTDPDQQIQCVTNFQDLVSTPFQGKINAIGWTRQLIGDFAEIVEKVELKENLAVLELDELRELELTKSGQLARAILLNDYYLLKEHGASPTLNLIRFYERDDAFPFFPTDVYSFHVDRATVPSDTFLCTYYGQPSELLPNSQASPKVLIPEIRQELQKLYNGPETGFESFLQAHYFDLHYQPKPNANTISLGLGHLWRLAIDYPGSPVLPCVHRAPKEKDGTTRLLMIC